MRSVKRESVTATPFASAEDAWFWCVALLATNAEGAPTKDGRGIERSCGPNDIYLILERIVAAKTVSLEHVRVLMFYGKLQYPPPSKPRTSIQRHERETWDSAIAALDRPMRLKGIVV